jgi:hypothetical protein
VGILSVDHRRRTIAAPRNPLDKCTVVSIYPKEIREVKHTIQPGYFLIKAGSIEHPAILVVGSSSWWREIDEEQPLLEIPNSSIQVADSIVKDYCNGLLACNMGNSMPGLFYLHGEKSLRQIREDHKADLSLALERQKNWYTSLLRLADSLWARTNGNPLVISEDMRLAARELDVENKDWMVDFKASENVRCVACGAFRNPAYPICQVCKAIADPEMAKETWY